LCDWFFPDLSFKVWFVEDWASWFFNVYSFQSNDPGHKPEKLMRFNIFVFTYFLFRFYRSRFLSLKKKNEIGFMVFLNLCSIWLSWTYNLGYEFFKLIWVDLPHITHVICVLCYPRLTQAPPLLIQILCTFKVFFCKQSWFLLKKLTGFAS
jgi:hypothetical protein